MQTIILQPGESVTIQAAAAPVPPPVPPQPIPGYDKTLRFVGVFPPPASSNQRTYVNDSTTSTLVVFSFTAPANATYLGIAASAQAGQRTMEWSISANVGDFDTPWLKGSGVDLSLRFRTSSGGTNPAIPAGNGYFNVRFPGGPTPPEPMPIVVYFQRPVA